MNVCSADKRNKEVCQQFLKYSDHYILSKSLKSLVFSILVLFAYFGLTGVLVQNEQNVPHRLDPWPHPLDAQGEVCFLQRFVRSACSHAASGRF